jgi:hypothetical protein
MAMIYSTLRAGDQPTAEDLEQIEQATHFPITFTADAPQLTDQQLAEFKPVSTTTRHAESALESA